VGRVREAIAPMREVALFLLMEEKSEAFPTLSELEMICTSTPKGLLLALLRAYNATPENAEDTVPSKVLKSLRKAVEREAAESAEALGEAMEENGKGNGASPAASASASPRNVAASLAEGVWGHGSGLVSDAAPGSFRLNVDLSQSLGKFCLGAVELPTMLLSAQPALAFLQKKDETLVL
jgi:hypothetical protein